MNITETLGKAAAQLESAAEEAANAVKTKYHESVSPEQQEKIKGTIDKGISSAEKAFDKASDVIERGIKGFTDGYNSAKKK